VDVVFSTAAADSSPPTVTARTPAPNATGVSVNTTVTATFSEAVTQSTINFTLRNPSNVVVPATMTYNSSNRTATLTPSAALAASTTYTASLSGAQDTAGNSMSALTWSFTTAAAQVSCPCTIWPASTVPTVTDDGDTRSIEVGVKFRANVNGSITGIRFYKAATNAGPHTAHLWSANGTLLATASFTNETTAGWQQANFATPVAITANTVYVASYHTNGHYADDVGYFANSGVDRGPLRALQNGEAGVNGVYAYGANAIFPTNPFQASNYWVDVVFQTAP
jgi:hypothetical protein